MKLRRLILNVDRDDGHERAQGVRKGRWGIVEWWSFGGGGSAREPAEIARPKGTGLRQVRCRTGGLNRRLCSPKDTGLRQHLNRRLGGRCQRPPALPCGLPAAGCLAPLGSTPPMLPRFAQDDKVWGRRCRSKRRVRLTSKCSITNQRRRAQYSGIQTLKGCPVCGSASTHPRT